MQDDEPDVVFEEDTTAIIIKPDYIEKHKYNQSDLEAEITKVVDDVVHSDIRLENTPEVREAIRDYVRIEMLFAIKIDRAIAKPESIDSADERMIRSLAKIKMDLRGELWQNVRGQPGKDRSMNITREVISKKIIKAQQEVDPLG